MRHGALLRAVVLLVVVSVGRAEKGDLGGLRPPWFRPPSVFEVAKGAGSAHGRRRLGELGSDGGGGGGNVTDAWIRTPAEFPTSIPGQFIAALDASHDAAVNVTALADSLLAPFYAHGARRVVEWADGAAFTGFAFRVPPAAAARGVEAALLEAVKSHPAVAAVEADQVYAASVIMAEARGGKWEVPTPLFRMRAAAWSTQVEDGALVQPSCSGSGSGGGGSGSSACRNVVVAVLDTGVDGAHPDLAGNIVGGESFTGGNPLVDENGHGTHVAGTVCANNNGKGSMGLTPGQRVYALQVFDQLGSGSTTSIVAALNWLARYGRAKGIRVANMSLGGPKSYAVCRALDAVVAQGITLVVAAGNKGVSMYSSSPADCNSALAVTSMTDYDGKPGGVGTPEGATNADDTFTDFSNFAAPFSAGRVVAAPGRLVLSTWSQRACGRYGIECVPWGPYAFMSGTSMAAPLVSALAARCYLKGVCRSDNATEMGRLVANSVNYNAAHRDYGFVGDPLRPARGRYFGYLVWGNQW